MEKLQMQKNEYTKGTVCDVPFTELQKCQLLAVASC